MAIKLSNLTFTDDEDDIVPPSAVEQILNTEVANTLAADDIIIGIGNDYGFENVSVLSTDDSNGTITGIENLEPEFGSSYGIVNSGALNADEDNDILTGTSRDDGIVNSNTLNADDYNDRLTGTASRNSSSGLSSLTIHSIKCIWANGDPTGPDDTYIEIDGRKIWGDYNMNDGRTRSVDYYFVNTLLNPTTWVELFDDDHGWSRDDSMGGFNPVNTRGQETMQLVERGICLYEVYYSSRGLGDYIRGQDYTSGGTRDYTSGGTRGGNVRMPI
jgi:hypothetical protein